MIHYKIQAPVSPDVFLIMPIPACFTSAQFKQQHPQHIPRTLVQLISLFFLPLLMLISSIAPAFAAKTHPAADVANTNSNTSQADLQELRSRIESLRKEVASGEAQRADIADNLREAEKQISTLQRDLYELASQKGELQSNLKSLETQSQTLEIQLQQHQKQLEKQLYQQYTYGQSGRLQLLFSGEKPTQISRNLYYLSLVARQRHAQVQEIEQLLDKKKQLAKMTKREAEALRLVEQKQLEQQNALLEQRKAKQTVFSQISDKIATQRKEIGQLEANEKRLAQLIDRITRMLAARAAKAKETAAKEAAARELAAKEAAKEAAIRATTAARTMAEARTAAQREIKQRTIERETKQRAEQAAERGKTTENTVSPPVSPTPSEPVTPPPSVVEPRVVVTPPPSPPAAPPVFRAGMPPPIRGAILGRFGAIREGTHTWKGVFIGANTGEAVHAIATGRVVYADWMRGFGNLLIIDHGNGYLSIYGNNDALLKQIGDVVQKGETIANIGNSGGNAESGLYFEIRHQGQPLDPLRWVSLK